jgi:hypothetical protein
MPYSPTAKTILTLLSLLIIIGLIGLSYQLKSGVLPLPTLTIAPDPTCNLRMTLCTSVLPKGAKVSFAITPKDIPLLQPLTLEVITEDIKISKVEVDITGLTMDMGYNRTILNKTTKHNFKGSTTIPICIRNKMDWQASVLLQTNQGLISVPFYFQTLK